MRKKNKKIAMFIGKFLPPHMGHINQILKCEGECDKLYVIVADSVERSKKLCSEASFGTIYPKTRYEWIKKYFKSNKKIKVKLINQGMLEAFPDNLESWKKKVFRATKHTAIIWYVDKNYLDISHKVFPEFEFIGFDRTAINISATNIRKDYIKNRNYVLPEAQVVFDKFIKNA